ncbi:MAG: histidinol-phosphate aminotransferase family protein, partial [Pseudomonadota bacterium]|nr:histidinol-phosphate aminotransferase family protein [Pseudomonadota bacterium]
MSGAAALAPPAGGQPTLTAVVTPPRPAALPSVAAELRKRLRSAAAATALLGTPVTATPVLTAATPTAPTPPAEAAAPGPWSQLPLPLPP